MGLTLLGKKIGMTRVYNDANVSVPVTVIEVGPCVVTQVRTDDRDGYAAVQVGYGEIKPRRSTMAMIAHDAKAGTTPKRVHIESRLGADEASAFETGQTLGVDRFEGVAAPAEKLPWEDGSLDRVFTRSVLIHADLDAALAEIRRVLKPGGRAVFVEPLAANPFANLYRRFLGPSEWRSLTRYFTQERVERVGEAFGNLSEKRFYFFGFGAFAFQFALSSPALFRLALAGAAPLDAALLRVLPAAWRRAWFVVLSVRKEA